MQEPLALEALSLTKRFGGVVATDNVDITLPVGSRHALIGPNGAGKTTLVNLLSGSLGLTSGTVKLNSKDVTGCSQKERVRRGLVRTFQITNLFPRLKPIEAVATTLLEKYGLIRKFLSKVSSEPNVIDEAYFILESVGLSDEALLQTNELSYGKQRQLEIAIALASQPKVLLLDEPAAGVPESQSEELFNLISSLPSDLTVLFIEHDMDLVFRFADRITVMDSGRVLCEGSPSEVAADTAVRSVYFGDTINV